MKRLPFVTDEVLAELDTYLDSDLHRILGTKEVEELLASSTGINPPQSAYCLRYWNKHRKVK